MKGIGSFVLVLLLGLGVTGYIVTRPPDRELDAQERAWIRSYEGWMDTTERRVETALVNLTFESVASNLRRLEPLRGCSASFARIGRPPALLVDVQKAALAACGEAEHAMNVYDRFDIASLATVRLHLDEAGDQLRLSRYNLRRALEGPRD